MNGFYNRDEKCLQRGTDWVLNKEVCASSLKWLNQRESSENDRLSFRDLVKYRLRSEMPNVTKAILLIILCYEDGTYIASVC